jgi:hypothetical protein
VIRCPACWTVKACIWAAVLHGLHIRTGSEVIARLEYGTRTVPSKHQLQRRKCHKFRVIAEMLCVFGALFLDERGVDQARARYLAGPLRWNDLALKFTPWVPWHVILIWSKDDLNWRLKKLTIQGWVKSNVTSLQWKQLTLYLFILSLFL